MTRKASLTIFLLFCVVRITESQKKSQRQCVEEVAPGFGDIGFNFPQALDINSVKLENTADKHLCVLDQTYGVSETLVWFSAGCETEVEVCFEVSSDPVLARHEDLIHQALLPSTTTPDPAKVLAEQVAGKQHQVCVDEHANGHAAVEFQFPGAEVIDEVTISNTRDPLECVYGQTYGVHETVVWVDAICQGTLHICYSFTHVQKSGYKDLIGKMMTKLGLQKEPVEEQQTNPSLAAQQKTNPSLAAQQEANANLAAQETNANLAAQETKPSLATSGQKQPNQVDVLSIETNHPSSKLSIPASAQHLLHEPVSTKISSPKAPTQLNQNQINLGPGRDTNTAKQDGPSPLVTAAQVQNPTQVKMATKSDLIVPVHVRNITPNNQPTTPQTPKQSATSNQGQIQPPAGVNPPTGQIVVSGNANNKATIQGTLNEPQTIQTGSANVPVNSPVIGTSHGQSAGSSATNSGVLAGNLGMPLVHHGTLLSSILQPAVHVPAHVLPANLNGMMAASPLQQQYPPQPQQPQQVHPLLQNQQHPQHPLSLGPRFQNFFGPYHPPFHFPGPIIEPTVPTTPEPSCIDAWTSGHSRSVFSQEGAREIVFVELSNIEVPEQCIVDRHYGIVGTSFWVDIGCQAEFEVCFSMV